MKSHSRYYLDAWLATDGTIMFHEVDSEVYYLLQREMITCHIFTGERATVIVFSISEGLFRWSCLKAASDFMSGNYRSFSLKSMEWTSGIEH